MSGRGQSQTNLDQIEEALAGIAGIRVETEAEQPERQGDRQRFLIWALTLGAIPPERMVERVLQDVEAKGAPCQ